jgi:hypothetical protein
MYDIQTVSPGSVGALDARAGVFGAAAGRSIATTFDGWDERDYRPGLPTRQLVAEVRGLLATERRAERSVCRYLADLADRVQARRDANLDPYVDEFHAARCFFGLGARETRERVRIGRALRQLPQIDRAFRDGDLSYSRVREVTRVATEPSESHWLELGRRLDMRSLERRVAMERMAMERMAMERMAMERMAVERMAIDRTHAEWNATEQVGVERTATGARADGCAEWRADKPVRTKWTSPNTVRVSFEFSSETWSLLERAMREARRASAAGLSDDQALQAIARAALSTEIRHSYASAAVTQRGSAAAAAEPGTGATQRGSEEAGKGVTRIGSSAEVGTQLGTAPGVDQGKGAGPATLEARSAQSRCASPDYPTDERVDGERLEIVSGEGLEPCEPTTRLIRVMGRCRGWTSDALVEASGLSVREVAVALTLLELDGRVTRRALAFDPV